MVDLTTTGRINGKLFSAITAMDHGIPEGKK
jgi:hypothetical protein